MERGSATYYKRKKGLDSKTLLSLPDTRGVCILKSARGVTDTVDWDVGVDGPAVDL